jgi:hypothetical protein
LKSVSVSQDRDKGVVSLTGQVPSDSDKAQAETIANSMAAGQVVADQIAVVPPGAENDAKAMNSDLDEGIEKNLDAALIQNGLKKTVDYNVKSGVVTLKGEVNSRIQARLCTKGRGFRSECSAGSQRVAGKGSEGELDTDSSQVGRRRSVRRQLKPKRPELRETFRHVAGKISVKCRVISHPGLPPVI